MRVPFFAESMPRAGPQQDPQKLSMFTGMPPSNNKKELIHFTYNELLGNISTVHGRGVWTVKEVYIRRKWVVVE